MTDIQTIGLEEMASLLDLDPRRIQQLAQEGIVVKAKRGEYELFASVQGYVAYLRTQASGNQGESGDHKTRRLKAQADLAELKVLEQRGELINKSWALAAWGEAVQMMKTNLLGLPLKLAQMTRAAASDAEAKQIIENGITKALSAIANVEIRSIDVDDQV